MKENDVLKDLKTDSVNSLLAFRVVGHIVALMITIGVVGAIRGHVTLIQDSAGPVAKLEDHARGEGYPDTTSPAIRPPILNYQPSSNPQFPARSPTKATSSSFPTSFDRSPLPLPNNGREYWYTKKKGIAPLKITVPLGGKHYYVKLSEAGTGKNIKGIFVRAGQSVTTTMPLGDYRLKYAVGDTWYGRAYLFGPATQTMVAITVLNFSVDNEIAKGHEIELIPQAGGNLETHTVQLENF